MSKLLRATEVAYQLGLSPRTIESYARRGLIPFVNVGSTTKPLYRFSQAAVDEFLGRRDSKPGRGQ